MKDPVTLWQQISELAQDFYSWMSFTVVAMIIMLLLTAWLCRKLLMETTSDFVIKWSNGVHSGYGNLFFAMISILWASSVSVFGTDLKAQWFENTPVAWESVFFVITVCIALIIGFLHYIGQQRKEMEKQSNPPLHAVQCASQHTIDLTNALHSCLLDWDIIFNNIEHISLNEIKTYEGNLKKAKKQCLQAMLNVVKNWDESNDDGIVYKANLFNFAQSSDVLKSFEESCGINDSAHNGTYSFNVDAINKSPFFLFNDNWRAKLERCDFIMVNEQTLSVSIPSTTEDKSHSPICMPFSEEGKSSAGLIKQPNLHGAPMARKKKKVVYLADLLKNVTDKIDLLENSPTHKPYVNDKFKQDLISYYESDSAGSIISIPIHRYKLGNPFSDGGSLESPEKDEDKVTCILNIYANKSYILANNKMADAYSDLTKPIWYILSILVSLRIMLVELQALMIQLDYTLHDAHVMAYQGDNQNG